MKLNELAFAHSIALVMGGFYLVFYILLLLSPQVFGVIFNAQFLGADVASLMPEASSLIGFLITLASMVLTGWIMGYVWAWLYNQFTS